MMFIEDGRYGNERLFNLRGAFFSSNVSDSISFIFPFCHLAMDALLYIRRSNSASFFGPQFGPQRMKSFSFWPETGPMKDSTGTKERVNLGFRSDLFSLL
jgi:hypothetical protein